MFWGTVMLTRLKKWINSKIALAEKADVALEMMSKPGWQAASKELKYNLFDAPYGLTKTFPSEMRKDMYRDLQESCIELYQSENSIFDNRNNLIASVMDMSKYGVLILNPDEDTNHFCESPGISGELIHYINDIVKNDKEIQMSLKDYDQTKLEQEDLLYSIFLVRHWKGQIAANFYHTLRIDFNDLYEDNDWYRPLIIDSYILEEHKFRKKLGLPQLLDEDIELHYFSFLQLLLNDERNPMPTLLKMKL